MAKKILLLDDNADILEIVEAALTYENFEVKCTERSTDLMRLVATWQPNLVMVDYRLADGNGGVLCKTIKADGKLKHIPVIIFSAYLHKDVDFSSYGADAVIAKPFGLDHLVSTVNGLLEMV